MLLEDLIGAEVEGSGLPELPVPVLLLGSSGWDSVQRPGHLIGYGGPIQGIRAEDTSITSNDILSFR